MIHFKTKNNLMAWLIDNCPRKAVVRSLLDKGAECLGGFDPIPPSTSPGWIVRVTSRYGKIWIVAILAYKDKVKYGIRILSKIPWESYVGGSTEVYEGDRPSLYKSIRDTMKRKQR